MVQVPLGPKTSYCPLWRKKMVYVCHTCPLWVQLRGKDPSTGKDIDEWNCSLALLPQIALETAKQTMGVAAAVESARNDAVQTGNQVAEVVAGAMVTVSRIQRQQDAILGAPQVLIGSNS